MVRIMTVVILVILLVITSFFIVLLLFNTYDFSSDKIDSDSNKGALILVELDDVGVGPSGLGLDNEGTFDSLSNYEGDYNQDCELTATCGLDSGDNNGGGSHRDDDPECDSNSDCRDDYYGDDYCWFGNLYSDLHDFSCDYECDERVRRELIESCIFGCDGGACLEPECVVDDDCALGQVCDDNYKCIDVECFRDLDCDDSEEFTQDLCIDAGTWNSFCEHTPISCNVEADCGFDDFIGDAFCQYGNNDVFQNYLDWTCDNAGTVDSVCNFTLNPIQTDDCNDLIETCFDGVCHTITCFDDTGCDDSDALTYDSCVNPGEVYSFCDNIDIECNVAADCGVDDFVGTGTCGAGDDVFKDYITWTCNFPGTILSSCFDSTASQLFQPCADDCLGGVCGSIECSNDLDCVDGNTLTLDSCLNPGQLNSDCQHTPIVCNVNLDCDDGNALTIDSCLNPGTVGSSCENLGISCNLDIDCGVDDFFGIRFCDIGDVFQNKLFWTCLNPGTPLSTCVSSSSPQVLEGCDSGTICNADVDAKCVKDCVDGDLDGYDNCTLSEPDGDNLLEDCDDGNDSIYPGAEEVCDGYDNNCNGLVDEGLELPSILDIQYTEDRKFLQDQNVIDWNSNICYEGFDVDGYCKGFALKSLDGGVSATKICNMKGYNTGTITDSGDWSSPWDNTIAYWDGFGWKTQRGDVGGNRHIDTIRCSNPVNVC